MQKENAPATQPDFALAKTETLKNSDKNLYAGKAGGRS